MVIVRVTVMSLHLVESISDRPFEQSVHVIDHVLPTLAVGHL